MSSTRVGTYSPFEPLSDDALLSLGSMEGLFEAPSARKKALVWPGYAAAAGIGAIAYAVHYLPFAPFWVGDRRPISASIIAIVAAILCRNLLSVPPSVLPGCKSIVRRAIPAAIVLTGAGLNLGQVGGVGWKALCVTGVCMTLALGAAVFLGRRLGLMNKTSLLIGAGTAICGTSAIVAVAPVIDAAEEDVTLAVGTVNLLGLALMFALPAAGALLGLGQEAFGVWAGVSIHAVPQVVAAGFTYGAQAGALATLVKLARVTLLAPFLFLLMFAHGRKKLARPSQLVPMFIWGFLALAVLNTASLIPTLEFRPATWLSGAVATGSVALAPWLVSAGNGLLTLAMAAIGLEVNLRLLVRVGGRALLAGFGSMVVVCAAAWVLIRIML